MQHSQFEGGLGLRNATGRAILERQDSTASIHPPDVEPRAHNRIVFGAAALLSLLFCIKTWDWDDFWHLATGRWIASHHAIPAVDPFSFSVTGQRWHTVSWLPDVLFYAGYAAAGMAGVTIVKVLAALATLALLGLTLAELGATTSASIAALALATMFHQSRNTSARPEVFAAVLLAGMLFVSARYWQRRAQFQLAWLVPLTIVWLAVHTSVVLAPVLALVVLIAAVVTRRPRAELFTATIVAFACAAFFALPAGRDVLYVVSIHNRAASPTAFTLTAEWQRPDVTSAANAVPLALFVMGAIAGVTRWRERLPCLGWGFVGIFLWTTGVRNEAIAALLFTPLWGFAIADAARWIAAHGLGLVAAIAPLLVGVGAPMLHLVIAPFQRNRMAFGFGVEEKRFPGDTLAALRKLEPGRTINDFQTGGYLIWHDIPGGVFWDGRNLALYTDRQIRDVYLAARDDAGGLEAVANRFGVQYGIASAGADFAGVMMISPSWVPVYYGSSSILFVRASRLDRAVQAGLPALGLLRFLPFDAWLRVWYAPIMSMPERREELAREMHACAAMTPDALVLRNVLVYLDEFAPQFAVRMRGELGIKPEP